MELGYSAVVEPVGDAVAPWIDLLLTILGFTAIGVGTFGSTYATLPRYPPPLKCVKPKLSAA